VRSARGGWNPSFEISRAEALVTPSVTAALGDNVYLQIAGAKPGAGSFVPSAIAAERAYSELQEMSSGRLVIISGPSGAGKSTVVDRLLRECPLPLVASVSATTRLPRPGEEHGVDYYFLTREEFQRRREAGDFLECCEVFGRGHWYGTLRSEVASGLKAGKWVILEIDVEGAMKVLDQASDVVTVFIHPGSMEELERRLRGRRTEAAPDIERRLDSARREMTYAARYSHVVVNHTVDQAVREICEILTDIYKGEACSTN
jgi:guanylate kinase